jgi:hypothetical protein
MMMSARWALPRLRRLAIALAVLALVGAGASVARAGDGAQFSTDCGFTYINKKVGANEQWAITWDLFVTAAGNVFKLDGSPPSFIECILQDEDDTNYTFNCSGSSACAAPQCGGAQWVPIATNIAIPRSFFFPPGVDPADPGASCDDTQQ